AGTSATRSGEPYAIRITAVPLTSGTVAAVRRYAHGRDRAAARAPSHGARGAARPRAARRRAADALRTRGGRGRRQRAPVPRLPPGRPRLGGAAAALPAGAALARPCAPRLPRPPSRPARHRALDADRHAAGRGRGRAGRAPRAAPGGRDREGRRGASADARRGALERARAELRRLLRAHLPLVPPRGARRGVLHGRAAAGRTADGGRLPGDLRARPRAEPPVLRALPRRS